MVRFKTYLEEASGKGLTMFDVDETMFKTKARVHVTKDGKVIKKLTNQEFNKYKLKSGEDFDFGEFTNAKIFNQTSTPIARMINKVKAILKNAVKAGSKVIIVTARPNFDDRELFLDTFRNQGIDIDKIYVERAGNLGKGPAADNKKVIFKKYLDQKIYKRLRLFDDAKDNLKAFLSLQDEYPSVTFEAFLAKANGSVSRYR
ncbi:MAG: hypothetical protein CBB96_05505 [Gammaproteobacteria bacterium TMED36]|mgnify:FL=1|nr:MAG: hypothetical protein CBB96_05505 [Gammaproteobacteria bacterium TMED36]|tara:strand:+ start:5676 stop:6281 length:606 start_codon:yes stop_codon:yes gene_type:complete